jgi:5-(aminomethyl)-3-furanmethanol phosphate kinase
MGAAGGVTIVKLGGSLAGSPLLPQWLDALADCAGRVVMVPGGGPFADAVRAAQPQMGFDDGAAHRMAVLAMDQFAHALVGIDARLTLADTFDDIQHILGKPAVPVWLPARAVIGAVDIPCSWDVTSDSLAAWLAGKIGAKRVTLVKLGDVGNEPVSAAALASQGVVDAAFPGFLRESGATACILGASNPASLGAALVGAPGVGACITLP